MKKHTPWISIHESPAYSFDDIDQFLYCRIFDMPDNILDESGCCYGCIERSYDLTAADRGNQRVYQFGVWVVCDRLL